MSGTLDPAERAWLRQFLTGKFSLSELKMLAFDVGVDCHCFGYEGTQEFARELIAYLERRERLSCLITEVLKHSQKDEVAKLMAKLPPCTPQAKLQLIASADKVNKLRELLEELASKLGIRREEITLIAAASGSARLLVCLPQEAASQALGSRKGQVRGSRYRISSIRLFDSMYEINKRAWLVVARHRPAQVEGDSLVTSVSWLEALYRANLRGGDLSLMNLAGSDLSGAELSRANLSKTTLFRADLSGADLSGADLSGANLSGADLSGADLSGADLSGAKLFGANLSGADLREANLRGINLSKTDLPGVGLSGANLNGANLFRADLSRANLLGSNLFRVDLRGAQIDADTQLDPKWRLVWEILNQSQSKRDLHNADLHSTDLRGADLHGTSLRGADLSESSLSSADLRGADLRGADLNKVDLRGAQIDADTQLDPKWRLAWEILNQPQSKRNLHRADLRGADLRGADLNGVILSESSLRRADLREADLSGADLSGADLSGSDLRGANLRRARLSVAKLRGADLGGADLTEADLSGADLREVDLRQFNPLGPDASQVMGPGKI